MYKALYLSPMVPSSDVKGTVSFFADLFHFKIGLDDPTYSIVYKDNLTIHISRSDSHLNELEFYLEVDNLDEVWEFLKSTEKNFKVNGPINQEYGMRELHIQVPFTKSVMFVGQEIKQSV